MDGAEPSEVHRSPPAGDGLHAAEFQSPGDAPRERLNSEVAREKAAWSEHDRG